MSTSSKSMSGLKTVKRDWSDSQSQKNNVEVIEWPPTLPRTREPVMTPRELRLKAIQDAIAGRPVLGERIPPNPTSQFLNGRLSPSGQPPAKKARQLPPSWGTEDKRVTTDSLTACTTWTSSVTTGKSDTQKPDSTSRTKPRVASVFLSQEQTHILKLVQEGHSVFYTGSAGELKATLLPESLWRTAWRRYWQVGAPS